MPAFDVFLRVKYQKKAFKYVYSYSTIKLVSVARVEIRLLNALIH